jgi:hypothetical protein
MTQRGNPPCYECKQASRGRKRNELHHPFGRQNEDVAAITVEIPGNWHRVLDARRAQRPEVLKRPGDNPLHQIAAVVATFGEAADAYANSARHEGWQWAASLADIFAKAAHSAAEWLLILAGKLDEWRPDWIGEMPEWRP